MSDTEFEGIVESPWSGGASPFAINSKKLGMWLFIVSDTLTFSALLDQLRVRAARHAELAATV